ncbi:MAG TPA: hypothetical protein VF813_09920, partial [Anaerolineaceae bacterium]
MPGNHLLLPFMLISVLALLEGLWAGLVRIGWAVPVFPALLPVDHGPLMVSGFLGSLIALERVAALRREWMYISPLLTGAGWVLSLAVPASTLGPVLITLGSEAAVLILVVIIQREPALHTSAIGLGAACWLVGNFLWLGGLSIYRVVLWWA